VGTARANRIVKNRDAVAPDPTTYLRETLIAAARRNIPAPVRDTVIADLRAGLSLRKFVPHDDIETGEVTGTQTMTFNIDVKSSPVQFQVDGHAYDPADEKLVRALTLDTVDEWTLKSSLASHPFHIHINPFQVVRILDPDGKDVSDPGSSDTFGQPAGTVDPQYRGLKGVWKDTLWVKNAGGKPYTLVVRTRYRRYIGEFVLHCHILDHEDQGMMQNVVIALPGGGHVHK
jgi:L-ascorbate oxidase